MPQFVDWSLQFLFDKQTEFAQLLLYKVVSIYHAVIAVNWVL